VVDWSLSNNAEVLRVVGGVGDNQVVSSLLETLRDGGARIRGAAVFAFADPAWPVRYLTVALALLIPVVGVIAMFGWQARVHANARLGRRTLPHIDLPGDIRGGLPTFVSLVFMVVVPITMVAFLTLPLDALEIPWSRVDPALAAVVFAFFALVAYPEVVRRAIVHGEYLALLKPFPSFRAVGLAPLAYLFAVIGALLAGVLTALGLYAFIGGILFTAPIGQAMAAHVVMQWQRDLETASRGNP
jgi:hypothetical protein